MQQTRQKKSFAKTGQCWEDKKMSSSCTVHPTCSVYIIEESQCGDKGAYNHNRNSAEFLLTDGCRGVSVPEMETVVLLRGEEGGGCPGTGPVLQRALSYPHVLCFSEHCSGCAGSHFCAAHQ